MDDILSIWTKRTPALLYWHPQGVNFQSVSPEFAHSYTIIEFIRTDNTFSFLSQGGTGVLTL